MAGGATRIVADHDAVFMVPTGGYDSFTFEGGFYDPEADRAFVEELSKNLPPNIRIVERPTHIDDPAFATKAAHALIQLIEARSWRACLKSLTQSRKFAEIFKFQLLCVSA